MVMRKGLRHGHQAGRVRLWKESSSQAVLVSEQSLQIDDARLTVQCHRKRSSARGRWAAMERESLGNKVKLGGCLEGRKEPAPIKSEGRTGWLRAVQRSWDEGLDWSKSEKRPGEAEAQRQMELEGCGLIRDAAWIGFSAWWKITGRLEQGGEGWNLLDNFSNRLWLLFEACVNRG